mmetsp:Transcript_1580/g.2250  ORF Transcript_1580/g.2250 Transcript_1580/m.2250 type:complete len:228 (-) Transcript_1580:39-722(-)
MDRPSLSLMICLLLMVLILQNGKTTAWVNHNPQRRMSTAIGMSCSTTRHEFLVSSGFMFGGFLWNVPAADAAASNYKQERGSADKGLCGCPGQPMKKSCWSTEDTQGRRIERWLPPSDRRQEAIVHDVEAVMELYPQEGQYSVDGGGWIQAEKNISGSNGGAIYLRYLFTSKIFKYKDDLEFVVNTEGKVSIRTASQNAGFDYDVNATRINYIAKLLEKRGWQVTFV